MRVVVSPRRVEVLAGASVPIVVTIVNDRDVIAGYAVRILGADPNWLDVDSDQVSLFPGETRVVTANLTLPDQVPAGTTRVAVQVRELTPPDHTSITEIDLVVPAHPAVRGQLDPVAVTAGRRGTFSLLVENTGNTVVHARPAGDDPENKVRFRFEPPSVTLAPGDHAILDMRVSARQPLLGAPAVRTVGVHLDDIAPSTMLEVPIDQPLPPPAATPARGDDIPLALGSFVQRAMVSRGSISLVGLLAAVTVFALVLTLALSRLVGASAADRDLALAVAQAGQGGAGQGTAAVSGAVTQLTTKKPLSAVSVGVYAADATESPVASAATDANGAYQVPELAAGDYKIAFRAAGYDQLWYPGVASAADATTVTLTAGQQRDGLGIAVGGVPATISGRVVGSDVGAATLFLETVADPSQTTPPVLETTAGTAGTPAGSTVPGTQSVPLTQGAAIVQSVPIGTDGTFTLSNVPSPSVYDLVVAKVGYATAIQRVDVGAGEDRTGVELDLIVGDGRISGTVTSPSSGPLAGATITATAGQSTSSAVSLTESPVGSFSLRRLPTPASITIVATLPGYNSATQVVTLTQGQQLTGVSLVLTQASGAITGLVLTTVGNAPAPGVSVLVTDGRATVQTVTQSGQGAGTWRAGGLAVPGTYTVTFSRSDLSSQTVSVSLDGSGAIAKGAQGATVTAAGVQVSLQPATATVSGQVTQRAKTGDATGSPLGEATVSFTSGSSTFTVRSASLPSDQLGRFSASGLPPGTYTVSVTTASATPYVTTLSLAAGDTATLDPVLDPAAIVKGQVVYQVGTGTSSTTVPAAGLVVRLYRSDQYPTQVLAQDTTDANGNFDLGAQAAPQSYVVDVRTSNNSDPIGSVTFVLQPSQVPPELNPLVVNQ